MTRCHIFFLNMPVICTKEKIQYYETITGRVLEKRKADSRINNETLRTFSVKNSDTPTTSKFFIGTSVPNSTVKGIINWRDTSNNTTVSNDPELHSTSDSVAGKTESQKNKFKKTTTEETKEDENRYSHHNSFSTVFGSEKLKELQELQKQLQKTYEPKPLFAPRRPTLESIKSAIEKAKQENERNKNVGTEDYDYRSSIIMSDASTCTEKIVRKKYKKNKPPKDMHISSSNSSPTGEAKTRNSKKTTVSIKVNKKNQPSEKNV